MKFLTEKASQIKQKVLINHQKVTYLSIMDYTVYTIYLH